MIKGFVYQTVNRQALSKVSLTFSEIA